MSMGGHIIPPNFIAEELERAKDSDRLRRNALFCGIDIDAQARHWRRDRARNALRRGRLVRALLIHWGIA